MKVTISKLEVTGNLTVNGHIIGGGSTPTASIGIDCADLAPNSTVSVTGTDTAGKITLTVASGEQCEDPGSAGAIVRVTFANAYSSTPYVTLTKGSNFDNELKEGVSPTSTYFEISAPTGTRYLSPIVPPAAGPTQYVWYYHVIQ